MRSASVLAGLVNSSRPALLRNASASSSSASAARSTRRPWIHYLQHGKACRQVADQAEVVGTHSRGASDGRPARGRVAQRAFVRRDDGDARAAAHTGRRRGDQGRVAGVVAARGSDTSSAPIHGGASAATTIGAATEPAKVADSIVPAVSALPRPATQIDGARRLVGLQRIQIALFERRGGGAHLRTAPSTPRAANRLGQRRAGLPRHRGRRRPEWRSRGRLSV